MLSKKRNSAILTLICVLSVVSCMMFAACTPDDASVKEPATTADSAAVADTTAEDTTAEATDIALTLKSEYAPVTAYDEEGAEVDINVVYGTGYATYGGSLCFDDNGTFTTYIGVFGNPNEESGAYKIVSDTEIELSYGSGKEGSAYILNTDSNGAVTEIKMSHRGFDVVFRCD